MVDGTKAKEGIIVDNNLSVNEIMENESLFHNTTRQRSAHKYFTITPNVNYKCPGSVAAIALPDI